MASAARPIALCYDSCAEAAMAQRTEEGRGGKQKKGAARRSATGKGPRGGERAPGHQPAAGRKPPGNGAQKSSRAAGSGKRPAGGAPEAGNNPAASDWSALADRAARKFAELVDKARPYMDKARPYVDKARPAAEKATEAGRRMAVDLEGGIDEAFAKVSERARDLLSKGQHTRVNIKFRGRTLAELPIAVVAAAEVASLWWFGPLRLLLGHFVGKTVLDVEFISNADEHVAAGRALLADGDVEDALAEFDRALAMDRRCEGAHLGRGIALKLSGDKIAARAAFERAEELDPHGEVGREARRHLDNLGA
jgi:tetratricopeptide (TPR) repeat protein